MRSRHTFAVVLVIAGLAVAAGGCGKNEDPVRAALDELVAAAEDRDADDIGALLTEDFRAADGTGKAEALATVRRYLKAYESLDVEISSVETESLGDDAARATFHLSASGKPLQFGGLADLLPRQSEYDFEVFLVAEGGEWKLSRAEWKQSGGG